MRNIYLLFFVFSFSNSSFSQEFGGNPPTQKWKQINTDTVRIIFPTGTDSQANRIASIVHFLAKVKPASLGNQLKKINIVLQNQTTLANGYVQLGPFRSEFFMAPPLSNFEEGSIGWSDQLALHEYRHVQQYNNFNNGLSNVMKTLFGEEGYALAVNASIPDWFYEGDAVYNETVLTKQGRGRLPLFLNTYPSLWQSGKKYSWMKLRNGSYKDYVPNHYNLGYLLINYGREKYGIDFWAKVTTDASAFKGLFYPFQRAIKKYAGVDYKIFREQAFNFYKKNLEREAVVRDEYVKPVTKKYVTNYFFPYSLGIDSVLYLKKSYRHRPTFFLKDGGGEHKIKVRDISADEQYSYRNGRVVYAAFESDPRWGWRNYSVLKILNIETGKETRLTKKTKYFTPDISEDGTKVVAVQVADNGKSELHVLDAQTGEVTQKVQSPEINLFTDPKFINKDSIVTAVRLANGQMALAIAEPAIGVVTKISPASFNVVGYPCINNGKIFFTASYGGNDDVFALDFKSNEIVKISDGPFGNYGVNVANGKITWSSFTADGYQLKQVDEKGIDWKEMAVGVSAIREKFIVSNSNDLAGIGLNEIPFRNFSITKYKKGTGLLNFHSWRPYYEDPVFTFSLYGENVLNTLQTEIYYLYNQNDKTSAVGVTGTYAALFPYLSFGTEYTFNRETVSGNRLWQWSQLDSKAGLSIPLNYTSGKTYKSFNFSSYYVLRNQFNKGFFKDSLGNTSFSYLSNSISWTQQVQSAVQHIFPRLGYSGLVAYRFPLSRYDGYQFYSSAALYLPGILSTHSLVLTGGFQQRDTSRLLFSSRLANARGYSDYYGTTAGSRLWRLSSNYHLPLLYPDWGFANILYLQRIRGDIFYDWQRIYSNDKRFNKDFRSTGIELYADTKWWNQYPLTFGFRISCLLDDDPRVGNKKGNLFYEFILPVSILPK